MTFGLCGISASEVVGAPEPGRHCLRPCLHRLCGRYCPFPLVPRKDVVDDLDKQGCVPTLCVGLHPVNSRLYAWSAAGMQLESVPILAIMKLYRRAPRQHCVRTARQTLGCLSTCRRQPGRDSECVADAVARMAAVSWDSGVGERACFVSKSAGC